MNNQTIILNKLVILVIAFTLMSFSLLAAPIDQLEGRVNRTLKGVRALVDGKEAYLKEPKRQLSKLKGALQTIKAYNKLIEEKDKNRVEKLKIKINEEIKVITAYIEKINNEKQKSKDEYFNDLRGKEQLKKINEFEEDLANILKRGKSYKEKRPKSYYSNLNNLLKKINSLKLVESNKEKCKVLKDKINKEMDITKTYINSKKYKKIEKKRKQDDINSWKLGKTKMKTGKYYKIIKRELPKGKLMRIVIENPVWNIKREGNVIMYKYVYVKLALKYKKKCYFMTGELRSSHMGGGKYGKKSFELYRGRDYDIEMNCKNIYK